MGLQAGLAHALRPFDHHALSVRAATGLTGFPAAVVATAGLVSYYRMNEPSGTTMTDTQAANPGSYQGSPTLGSAALISHPADTAVTFASGTTFGLAKAAYILAGLTNWSILAFFKTSQASAANGNPIYCERAAAGNDLLKLQQSGGTPQQQLIYRDDAGTLNQINGTATINDGAAHMATATKSGTTVALYLDGVADGAGGTLTATNTFTNASPDSRIAGDKADGTVFWNGEIGEVALFNVALSALQVSNLYAAR